MAYAKILYSRRNTQRTTMTSKRSPTIVISRLVTMVIMMMTVSSSYSQEQPSCPIIQVYEPSLTKPGADLTLAFMISLYKANYANPMAGAEFACDLDGPGPFGHDQAKIAAIAATDNWPDSIKLPGLSVGKCIDYFGVIVTTK